MDRNKGVTKVKIYYGIKPNERVVPISFGLANVKFSVAGKQEGTVELDDATGLISRGKLRTDVHGKIIAVVDSEELSYPIAISGNVTMTSF